jgi:hypothetical protein
MPDSKAVHLFSKSGNMWFSALREESSTADQRGFKHKKSTHQDAF